MYHFSDISARGRETAYGGNSLPAYGVAFHFILCCPSRQPTKSCVFSSSMESGGERRKPLANRGFRASSTTEPRCRSLVRRYHSLHHARSGTGLSNPRFRVVIPPTVIIVRGSSTCRGSSRGAPSERAPLASSERLLCMGAARPHRISTREGSDPPRRRHGSHDARYMYSTPPPIGGADARKNAPR